MTAWTPGQIVKVVEWNETARTRGQRYRIVKVNPKMLVTENIVTGQKVAIDKAIAELAVGEVTLAKVTELPIVNLGSFTLGTVIRVKRRPSSAKWTYKDGALFAVIGVTSSDQVKIALLGGDDNRYWRMNPDALEIVKTPNN